MSVTEQTELISVILPVYNSEQSLEASVNSILAQTYKNLEIIIIDDASDDKTLEICRELESRDPRIKVVTNKNNIGALRSRFWAADMAKGEWIAFIDADDLWKPEKIEKQIELRDVTGCDLVYTASAFVNENGRKYNWIMNDFIKYIPSKDISNRMHEDFACWLCMLRDGRTARGINEPLITYTLSKTSRAGNKFKAARMNMNTYKYIKLGFFERLYYEACYAINGLLKYRHFI